MTCGKLTKRVRWDEHGDTPGQTNNNTGARRRFEEGRRVCGPDLHGSTRLAPVYEEGVGDAGPTYGVGLPARANT